MKPNISELNEQINVLATERQKLFAEQDEANKEYIQSLKWAEGKTPVLGIEYGVYGSTSYYLDFYNLELPLHSSCILAGKSNLYFENLSVGKSYANTNAIRLSSSNSQHIIDFIQKTNVKVQVNSNYEMAYNLLNEIFANDRKAK